MSILSDTHAHIVSQTYSNTHTPTVRQGALPGPGAKYRLAKSVKRLARSVLPCRACDTCQSVPYRVRHTTANKRGKATVHTNDQQCVCARVCERERESVVGACACAYVCVLGTLHLATARHLVHCGHITPRGEW